MDQTLLNQLASLGEPMSLLQEPRLLRAYIYGDPKVGKTDLTAKIVQALGEKAIWLSTDSGWTTVLKYPEIAADVWKMPFDSFKQIRLIIQAHDEGVEPYCDYNVLVVDTIGKAIDMMLRILVKKKPLEKEQYDEMLEARGHYRMVEQLLKDTVEMVNKSGMHVIYTSHIRNPNDEDRKQKRFAIRPDAPEASFRVLAREVNLIGWLYKENVRKIQFNPTLTEIAGTQISTIQEKTYRVEEVPELISKFINK